MSNNRTARHKRENRLPEIIKHSNKSLYDISEELEISYETLVNYASGKRMPHKNEIWTQLADYFKVPVPYIMGYEMKDGFDLTQSRHHQAQNSEEMGKRIGLFESKAWVNIIKDNPDLHSNKDLINMFHHLGEKIIDDGVRERMLYTYIEYLRRK